MNYKKSFYFLVGWFGVDILFFGPPPEWKMVAALVSAMIIGKLTARPVKPVNNERGERL